MAGDWIKMTSTLHEKPEIVELSSILSMERFSIVGRLHRFWSWVDSHSSDGSARGVADPFIDELVNCDGFAAALRKVDWLEVRSGSLSVPRFDRHNGQSAKKRVESTERKRKQRAAPPEGKRQMSRKTCDKSVTREEKRREEKNKIPPNPPGEWEGVFPKGSRQRPKTDQRRIKCLKAHPSLVRLGKLFGRASDQMPSVYEAAAFKDINPSPSEMDTICRRYSASDEYIRRDLATLLNNWSGELDRARSRKPMQPVTPPPLAQ